MFDRLAQFMQQLTQRLGGYPLEQVIIELGLIWVVLFVAVRFVAGSRGSRMLKAVFLALVIGTLVIRIMGPRETFQRLGFLYEGVLPVVVIGLLVIFQPELRRALLRAGEISLLKRRVRAETAVVDEIVTASKYLSRAKFGGLIVIERETPLKSLIDEGTILHARVSAPLLQTLFFPGSALHDLAVVIKGREVVAAGVQLPLAEASDMEDASLGARHRAAVGVSQETDAVVVVVSEETGMISLAERGKLTRNLSEDELRSLLILKFNRGLVSKLSNMPLPEPSPESEISLAGDSGSPINGDSFIGRPTEELAHNGPRPVERD